MRTPTTPNRTTHHLSALTCKGNALTIAAENLTLDLRRVKRR